MSFADAVDRSYRGAVELPAFARWSVRALAPHGFTSANALPLVGVCRDELLFPFEQAVHDEWGPAFDLSSLAGLLFLGRSGRAAAAQHAPGLDGRRRFVGFVAAHIGITGDGAVGRVHRPGQQAPSTACGALVALRDELAAGPLPSPRPGPVAPDPDDIEMGLLRAALTGRMTEPVTEIVALTELARRVATDELVRLSDGLLRSERTDVAVISAVVVHGPDGQLVAVREAWVRVGRTPPRSRFPVRAPDAVLFRANGFVVAVVLIVVVVGATALGVAAGRSVRQHRDTFREPASAVQASLLGFIGLLLAFGLAMAVDRYETRRSAVVGEANALGTTWLRAQTLAEPERSESLVLLRRYADLRVDLSGIRTGTDAFAATEATAQDVQRDLWSRAGAVLAAAPTDSAPRLDVETLNELIDADTTRAAALSNRIPTLVVDLQIGGSALAMGAFGLSLGLLDRGVGTGMLASVLVVLILLVVLDLDRPTRGVVKVPSTPLTAVRASMALEPATGGPVRP